MVGFLVVFRAWWPSTWHFFIFFMLYLFYFVSTYNKKLTIAIFIYFIKVYLFYFYKVYFVSTSLFYKSLFYFSLFCFYLFIVLNFNLFYFVSTYLLKFILFLSAFHVLNRKYVDNFSGMNFI